jgi:aspartate/methionine/tyrosine aminotransferase
MLRGLREAGFEPNPPAGAYYVMAGIQGLTDRDDVSFAHWLIETVGVATVPASSFYSDPELGRRQVRFSFPKRLSTIQRGLEALAAIRS